jgi:hypothetical protein
MTDDHPQDVWVYHEYDDGEIYEPRWDYSNPWFDFRWNPKHPSGTIWNGNKGSVEAIGIFKPNGSEFATYTEQYRPWNYTGKVNLELAAECRASSCSGWMARGGFYTP